MSHDELLASAQGSISLGAIDWTAIRSLGDWVKRMAVELGCKNRAAIEKAAVTVIVTAVANPILSLVAPKLIDGILDSVCGPDAD